MTEIIIAPIGYTKSYKRVQYHYNNLTESDWLSSRALLKMKYGKNWKKSHVIVIHPDNDGAITSMQDGWTKPERKPVVDVFSKVASFYPISVRDDEYISENDMARLMLEIQEKVVEIKNNVNDDINLIYDLTHSYRHLSFGALLQSIFLSDFNMEEITINEIYYAFARAPINQDDDVFYLNLNSFVDLVQDTGNIREAISQLRPKSLLDLSKRYGLQYKSFLRPPTQQQFQYLKWVSNQLDDIGNLLTHLQMGFVTDDILNKLQETNSKMYKDELKELEITPSIFYDQLQISTSSLIEQFKDINDWIPIWQRQLLMVKIAAQKQFDIVKAYLFLREAVVSYFEQAVQDADRNSVEHDIGFINTSLSDLTLSNDAKSFFNLINSVFARRNMYAHVYTDRFNSDNLTISQMLDILNQEYREVKSLLHQHEKMSRIITEFIQIIGNKNPSA